MAKEYKIKELKNGERRYVFDVNIGYRADGSRIRKTVTSKTIKDGRKKVAELLLDRTNQVVVAKGLLFKDLYDAYIADYKNKARSPSTVRNIAFSYRKKYARFENVRITKINDYDLIEWIEDLKKDLSPNTVRIREGALSAFFNWCIRKKALDRNPFVYIDKTKTTKPKLEFWNEAQFNQFISNVSNKKHKIAFCTLFYTGLRKGEFCGLSLSDLDEDKNELHLSHTVKNTSNGLVVSTEFKNEQSRRIVPIPDWLTPNLKEVLKSEEYPYREYYTYLNVLLSRYNDPALPKISIHGFRHSYISMLIHANVNHYTVSKIAGHSKTSTTLDIYGHLYPDERRQVTTIFSERKKVLEWVP